MLKKKEKRKKICFEVSEKIYSDFKNFLKECEGQEIEFEYEKQLEKYFSKILNVARKEFKKMTGQDQKDQENASGSQIEEKQEENRNSNFSNFNSLQRDRF